MAYPITDKALQLTQMGGGAEGSLWIRKKRAAQAKPYSLPANYLHATRWVLGLGQWNHFRAWHGIGPWYLVAPPDADLLSARVLSVANVARERFMADAKQVANWAVALAEGHQAVSMMARRLSQMLQFCRALRKGNLRAAADALGVKELKSTRSQSKSFSNNFLEWHFGWSPLLSDIHTSAEILSNDFRRKVAIGRAKDVFEESGGSYTVGNSGEPDSSISGQLSWEIRAKVVAWIEVSNPNLLLASQMGLTNPALIAWELVPFSFVVDWIFNVSKFLNTFDELFGLTLVEPYHSAKVRIIGRAKWDYIYPSGAIRTATMDSSLHSFQRARGLPNLTVPEFTVWPILSVSRAVTACSLLIQQGLRR